MRTPQDVDLDVEMQFAHALDQDFAGVFVGREVERGVFLSHLIQCNTHLFGTGFVFRRDRNRNHGIREHHRLKRCRIVRVCECVARARVLHAEQGDDIASLGRIQFLARVGVHLNDSTDALGLARERIENVVTLL